MLNLKFNHAIEKGPQESNADALVNMDLRNADVDAHTLTESCKPRGYH